jgi:autotransporter-associated beta strand protein
MQQAKHSRNKLAAKAPRAFAVVIAAALTVSAQAQVRYWDSNGATPGAGNAPNGTWGTDAFWNSAADGTGDSQVTVGFVPTPFAFNTGVFSSGSDAVDPYVVSVSNATATIGIRAITFEDGSPTITGPGVLAFPASAGGLDSIVTVNNTVASTVQFSAGVRVDTGTTNRLFRLISQRADGINFTSPITTSTASSWGLRLGGAGGGRINTALAPAGVTLGSIASNGSGANTWGGTWTIAGDQNLGSASITLSTAANFLPGATLNIGDNVTDDFALNGVITHGTVAAPAPNVTLNLNGNIIHGTTANNTNTLEITGGGTTNINGNYQISTANGFTPGNHRIFNNSTLNVSATSIFNGRGLTLGSVAKTDGTVRFAGNGEVNLTGGITLSRGILDIAGRTVRLGGEFQVGAGAFGGSFADGTVTLQSLPGSKIVLGGTMTMGVTGGGTVIPTITTDIDLGTTGLTTSPHAALQYRDINAVVTTVSSTHEISSVISGNVPLANGTGGILILSGNNTLTAGFHARNGSIRFMSDASMGAVPAVPTEWFRYAFTGLQLGSSFDIHPNREFSSFQQADTVSPLASATFTFDTNGFDSTYAGRITSPQGIGRDFNGFSKTGAGRLTLSGTSNNYSGATNARGGVLEFATVANINGGASSLGAPTSEFAGLIRISGDTGTVDARVDTPGTIRHIGPASTTDRTVKVTGNGAVLEASGTGSLVLTTPIDAGAWGITLGGTGEGIASGGFTSSVNGIRLIEIVPGLGGAGYTPGLVDLVIVDPTGTGATARGVVNPAGAVAQVELLTAGNGYTNPLVNVVGAGGAASVRVATQAGYGIGTASPLTKIGAGSWTLGGVVDHKGAVAVNEGTLNLTSTVTGLTDVTVADGATLAAGLGNTLEVDSLAIAATGVVNMKQGDLIVDYTGTSPIATLLADIAAGRLFGDGDFGGLPTYLAVAEAADLGATDLNGIAVDDTAVLVKYTYVGDANLDGQVDALDYERIDLAIGNSGVFGTAQGDLNYDGTVDALDYEQVDLNIGNGVGSPLATVFVPEPGVLGLLALGLTALSQRRARRV